VINNQKDVIMGGYRQGSGRSKSGYYKGIYCGSTYELCWVIHSLDHGVKFTRFPGKLESNGVVYYPDFLLDDGKTIIETKGYEAQESVDKKSKVAESLGYSVNVLRKKDLEYAFEYVQKTYNTTKFFTLYDEYKPKYSYTCSHCNMQYETDKVLKTDTGFCSRSCAGKFRKKHNTSKINYQKVSETLKNKPLVNGRKNAPYTRKFKQQWITNGIVNTRICIDEKIPEGFKKGRMSL
jgi:predicted nucleic acid-binding Zn ribbon protein